MTMMLLLGDEYNNEELRCGVDVFYQEDIDSIVAIVHRNRNGETGHRNQYQNPNR
jgi:hypothetical protein